MPDKRAAKFHRKLSRKTIYQDWEINFSAKGPHLLYMDILPQIEIPWIAFEYSYFDRVISKDSIYLWKFYGNGIFQKNMYLQLLLL